MPNLLDFKIYQLESMGLCQELNNEESEKVAGGSLIYPFWIEAFLPFSYIGYLGLPSSGKTTTKGDGQAKTTVEEGDGWKSTQTIIYQEKYYRS